MPPSTADRLADLEKALTRLVTLEESREDERQAMRELLSVVPARLSKMEGQLDSLTANIAQDAKWLDKWIAPDGYLRSKAFGGLVIAALVGGGVLTVTDVTGSMLRHVLGIEAVQVEATSGATDKSGGQRGTP